ncbi:MAG: translation initiation factor IF-2 [Clostridia bacterium]|nr:translation initiation factor IF-2 [Clostridia bacterium]
MAVVKHKINEISKDFSLESKKIIALVGEISDEPKKSVSVLSPEELDYIFDRLTAEHAVKDFKEYFAMQKPAEEVEKKPAKKAEKKETAAAAKKAEDTAKQPAASAKSKKKKGTKQEDASKPVVHKPSDPQPFKKKEKKENQFKAKTKGEFRTVDTRSSNVDLSKYDERFEEMGSSRQVSDRTSSTKQKLKKKTGNKYRGKQGIHRQSGKKETEAQRMRRLELERKKKKLEITVPEEITVADLALKMKITAVEVIKKLMTLGVMASQNDTIDFDTAAIVAEELHVKVKKEVVVTIEEQIIDDTVDEDENLQPRDPVVVVMGHVDHGKTSILDAIRNTDVTAGEAGGITQNIGAYRTKVKGRNITFLDTPGHAAFTAMRARGAKATDIAVIVVAADDGVMPQTVEAINHAKAADVQIIVAINKMDKPGANPDKVLNELTEHELVPEQWGGDVICVPVSAKTKEGLPELLDTIILVADMAELKANPDRQAKGVVIEAQLDKGRGPVATFLVQKGTLHTGDIVVAGTAVGRVRVMTNEHGKQLDQAGPSVPVEVMGLGEVPKSGDIFDAVTDEKLARELVEQRKQEEKQAIFDAQNKVSLENLFETIAEGEKKELKIIVKADVQGSVEAVTQNLQKLTNEEVKVNVIHGAVGGITESDVMLANASNAIIVGFNVRPDAVASASAQRDGVDIRTYRIIYDCIDEIKQAMKGMLAPKYRDVDIGRAEVRQTITISAIGTIAGCYVLEGKVTRDAKIRLVRDGIIITETGIASLRRFKDDVKEVVKGYECGIGLDNYNDIKEGDIFEAFITEEYRD